MDIDLARKLWVYDRINGILIWLPRPVCMFKDGLRRDAAHACDCWNTKYAGKIAGGSDSNNYVTVTYGTKRYKATHIIWLLVKGALPTKIIDHRDGDPSNNRWKNLRYCKWFN